MLTERFQRALAKAFGEEYADADPVIRPSQFADFQANAALALAKRLGSNPRDVAQRIVEPSTSTARRGAGDQRAGVRQRPARRRLDRRRGERSRRPPRRTHPGAADDPRRLLRPNVAKEMHVGHLRTTVVGDALVRTLEHLGHDVIRQNHIGDWGTPFGMLIEHLLGRRRGLRRGAAAGRRPQRLLRRGPRRVRRRRGVRGPGPDARRRAAGRRPRDAAALGGLVELSKQYFNRVYAMLGVTLTDDDLAGESTYNDELAGICDELEAAGIATISDGALCVFLDGFTGREGKPVAADHPQVRRRLRLRHHRPGDHPAPRARPRSADRILYVVGAPQRCT